MTDRAWWAPAAVLVVGAVLATAGVKAQHAFPLRAGLDATVPDSIEGYVGRGYRLSDAELTAAAPTAYLVRNYGAPGATEAAFTLYVGYYAQQTQGRTIHSPRNCLPGAGWEPLAASAETVATTAGTVAVNRYLLQNGTHRAVVFYWYQGRGRVAYNEYAVKWDLLRDAAFRRRSDEALARVVVPVTTTEAQAASLGVNAVRTIVPALYRALPE